MTRMRLAFTAVLALGVSAASAAGDSPTSSSLPSSPAHHPANPPIDCPLHEQGVSPGSLRPFAETEKYIQFLERSDRAAWQKPDEVVKALALSGRETLFDLGAGSGYFAFRFAKALPRGRVVATDVDPEMVRHIHHRVLSEGIANVKAVLTDPKDPGVSAEADVVFVCDVIHHVAGRDAWLRKAFSQMKAGARLVVIEFKEGKLPEGPPESVKISKAKLISLVERAGFRLRSDRADLLPYQTFLTFVKLGQSAAR